MRILLAFAAGVAFTFGTPDALRATALLLFLREATIPDTRPAHPALPDLVASST